jgi:hypothetical protein
MVKLSEIRTLRNNNDGEAGNDRFKKDNNGLPRAPNFG